MSSWVALNVEPDEAVEEEVDDTKEIQIEESLKLYQNALKLHSQGPQFYPQAAEAYDALFDSEIFKYPESLSGYKKADVEEPDAEPAPLDFVVAAESVEAIGETDINDSTSSTLLQTIYLSYKNYGQFLLDSLQAQLKSASDSPDAARDVVKTEERSRAALASFAEALDRDDTDLNLWRQSARLSGAMQSYRLARFCLESVLADDDNRLEVRTEQLGLEETIAEERLRKALQSLNDRLSVSQVPVKKPKKALIKFLERQADPHPYLPALPDNLGDVDSSKNPLALNASRQVIKPTDPTWEGVGKEILRLLMDEEDDSVKVGPGASVEIQLPNIGPHALVTDAQEAQPDASPNTKDDPVQSTEQPDVTMSDSQPKPEEPESALEQKEEQPATEQQTDKQTSEIYDNQPAQQPEDPNQQEAAAAAEDLDSKAANTHRKRSSASAPNDEHADNLRAKSRRTRARESNADSQVDEVAFDQSKFYEDRLKMYTHADEWMFEAAGAFISKAGAEELGTNNYLRKHMSLVGDTSSPSRSSEVVESLLSQDLGSVIKNWDETKAKVFSESDNFSNLHDIQSISKSGLAIFLEHSKKPIRKTDVRDVLAGGEGLSECVAPINEGWSQLGEVAFCWLKGLLMPKYGKYFDSDHVLDEREWSLESTYTSSQWPCTLKETVVQVLQREEEYIYNRLVERVAFLDSQILRQSSNSSFDYRAGHFSDMEMIQALFELHLDVYASMSSPNSEINQAAKVEQWDRLTRWSMLARDSIGYFVGHSTAGELQNGILLRHLWASTFHSNMAPDVPREHILLCLQDVRRLLDGLAIPSINLANNATMPELSPEAVDREVSKLKSTDFFVKIFSPESEDPIDIIETIEPLLEPSSIEHNGNEESESDSYDNSNTTSELHEMGSFLDRGDATLRLFLWRRLQEAYKAIDYPPKVISCYLRSIETIIKELWNSAYSEEPVEDRQHALLRWLKSLDSILSKAVTQVLEQSENAYECIDMDHLKSSISALVRLLKLLHSFTLYEDSVRVGQVSAPELRSSLAKSLEGFRERLREMAVRCWLLQYTFFREVIVQNKELFTTPNEDRIEYLRAVHYALGIRKMCRRSNKEFLKLMKSELGTIETKEDLDLEICQIFYDLHGYRLINTDLIIDHGCPPERIDRSTAIMMIDFVMRQALNVNIKDLSKSDLKSTIDKMQQAIGVSSSRFVPSVSYNKRVLITYLRAPINPVRLYRAAQGLEELPFLPVPTENGVLAQKGWFFLLGYAALTKFRSQKRLTPTGTSDLDEAIGYFRQDLDNRSERWETWYRLAQAYDLKLEEDITWSAEKINNNRDELATSQRYTIHCYAMALATANRTAEPTQETRLTMSELYTEFAIRMYASSREPLSMHAFDISGIARHFSNEESQQMYKGEPFKKMNIYAVWNFASHLLKRAIVDKPKNWINHFMLSKCLWKMYNADDKTRGNFKRVGLDDVLDSLLDAIDNLPPRKDSRTEPIFEPHYKLVSLIHKLVHRDILTPSEGSKTLLATPWARKVNPPEDKAGWKSYILEVLRNLKHADKSNWHHRMAVRTAHIVYDDQRDAPAAASAKHELSQQIFTKTMSIQVWRPEYERPGRHFVYTTRYVYFFVSLLDQLDDRAGLDQLLRRVRKKQGDFINHPKLWEDICLTYGRAIRRAGKINQGHEEGIFRLVSWDEFVENTTRLQGLPELAPESTSLLELLRDAIELKKLNNNLMKVSLVEDLIADIYSRLYEINLPSVREQVNEESREKMKVNHLLRVSTDGAVDVGASAPTTSSEAPAPARGRTKGIARRDIQKRAETIVNTKLNARAKLTTTAGTAETEPQHPNATAAMAISAQATKEKKPADQEPGSTHHNGDAESELSEIDDDKLSKLDGERPPLFPNLKPSSPEAEPGSEMSGIEGDAGYEGEEEEMHAPGYEGDITVEESFVTAADEGAGDETEVAEEDGGADVDEKDGDGDDDEGEGEGEGDGDGETEIFKGGREIPDSGNNADEPEPWRHSGI